jgi:cell wall-associated NlpC family hydrolase
MLARLVGRELHADGAPLEPIWAATPIPALRAVLFGLSQLGKPYVYATAGPDTYDCSGLTKRAWAETGIGLPHFSGAQLHVGLPIAPEQLRPGDLLTYGPDGSEHVVLYLGNGWVVQAGGRSSGVVVTPADVDPLHGFAGASRPIP